MSEFKGVNATKRLATPSEKVSVQDQGGRVRYIFDEYTVPVGGHVLNDTVVLGSIPKQGKVKDGRLNVKVANGAALTMDIGWKASASGSEVADADGLLNDADANTVGFVNMTGVIAGKDKIFADSVDIIATFNGAALAGCKFAFELEVTID